MAKRQTAFAHRPVNPGRLPYLYHFPEALTGVRRIAYVQAMDSAIQTPAITPVSLRALAELQCAYFADQILEGKRGTNNPHLFHQTFVRAFLEAFPACLEALTSGAYCVAPGLSNEERLAQHYEHAQGKVG